MNKQILIVITFFTTVLLFSQEVDKDSIGTEEINIVKPYTPKIKDAFKIKKNPELGNDTIQQKNPVEYSINSVPVASTFTPSKGKAKGVSKKKKERIYDNYVSVGFGNYTTPKAEVFVHTSTTRNNDFGALLKYHSSKDGVKDAVLDTDFLNAKLDLYYKESQRDFDWKINGGYHYQQYNWYGLAKPQEILQNTLDEINPKQTYGNINVGGDINYFDSFFKGATLGFNSFTDDYNSFEFHFLAKPKFQIPISSELIETSFRLEYILGKFDQNYLSDVELKYGYYNLGVSPTFKVLRDYLTVNLGANIVYSGATQNDSESKIFIYPNITASYEFIQGVMVLYASATGDLQQHSYRSFVGKNPFVSPTLFVGRTNEQYNAKLGIKGKLTSNVSYNINASYKSEDEKALYKLNSDTTPLEGTRNYQFANSFGVLYDDVNTISAFGEIAIDFSKEFRFGGNVTYNTYDMNFQEEAWNLPSLEVSAFANYNIKKWFAGANLFFVGERKDQYVNTIGILPIINTITNKSYIDLNLNFGYNFTDRLTAFATANNVLGTTYQQHTNFNVQGIQFLGGIKYKFDL